MLIKDEVYFVQDSMSKRVKIGYSADFKTRFNSLSSSNANKLFILGVFPGTEEDETKLHKKFIRSKVHGEWFHPDAEILEFIDQKNKEIEKNINGNKKKPDKEDFSEHSLYKVSDVAKIISLSRARMYQLIREGFFPQQLYDERTGRPYYTSEMVEEFKKVVRTNIGVNGKMCLFYGPRGQG